MAVLVARGVPTPPSIEFGLVSGICVGICGRTSAMKRSAVAAEETVGSGSMAVLGDGITCSSKALVVVKGPPSVSEVLLDGKSFLAVRPVDSSPSCGCNSGAALSSPPSSLV